MASPRMPGGLSSAAKRAWRTAIEAVDDPERYERAVSDYARAVDRLDAIRREWQRLGQPVTELVAPPGRHSWCTRSCPLWKRPRRTWPSSPPAWGSRLRATARSSPSWGGRSRSCPRCRVRRASRRWVRRRAFGRRLALAQIAAAPSSCNACFQTIGAVRQPTVTALTEGVEADTRQSGARGGGDEHAAAQAALIGRRAVATRKDERVVSRSARPLSAQQGSELGRERDQPRAVTGLRRNYGAFDDRPAHPQMRCWHVETRSLQRRPLASEIRSPVAASSSNSGRHFAGISSSRRTSSARVRKRRSCIDHARPDRRRGSTPHSAGFPSKSPSATAASSARRSGVSALAIERSRSRPSRPGRVVSQSTECCTAARSRSRTRTSRSKYVNAKLTSSRRYSRRVLMRTLSCPLPA